MTSFELIWAPEFAIAAAESGCREGLQRAGDDVLAHANTMVPLETGHLQSTGVVTEEGEQATISYDTDYAVHLHEHPEFKFLNGRRGKWLEIALTDEEARFTEIVGVAIGEKIL